MKKLTTTAILLIACVICISQGIYNNGGDIVINSSAYVVIDGASGNYYTTGNGEVEFTNATVGYLDVDGNWTDNNAANQAVKNAVNNMGWVRFKGSGTQTINCSGRAASTMEFPHLEVNNTEASAAADVTFSASDDDVKVKGQLTLTDGVVETGNNVLHMESATTGDLTAYSNQSFVYGTYGGVGTEGGLRREISGVATYEFPVGRSSTPTTNYHRLSLLANGLATTTDLIVSVGSIVEGGSNVDVNLSTFEDGTAITDMKGESAGNCLGWNMTPDAPPTGGNYGLQLWTGNHEVLTDNKFTILKRPSGSANYSTWDTFDGATTIPAAGAAGRTNASGYAEKTLFTSFSEVGVGEGGNVLPIELLSFTGKCETNKNTLKWETATETNNDFFTIERSINGQDFTVIGTVAGAINSNTVIPYEFTDENTFPVTVYYRLTQTDLNGKYEVFATIAVEGCEGGIDVDVINIYTYNYKDVIVSVLATADKDYTATLYDVTGKLIINTSLHAAKGANHFTLTSKRLATGVYMVVLRNEQEVIPETVFIR